MSTATAARPGSARVQALRPALRLLAPPLPGRWRPSFVALCSMIMLGCLGALLGINILLTRGAYTEQQLTLKQSSLTESEQSLSEDVAKLSSPVQLGARARALGMIPNSGPAFIELGSGTIAGSPTPASTQTAPGAGDLSATSQTAGQTADQQTEAAAEANATGTQAGAGAAQSGGVPTVDPGQGVSDGSAGSTSDGATPVQSQTGTTQTAATQTATTQTGTSTSGQSGTTTKTGQSSQTGTGQSTPVGDGATPVSGPGGTQSAPGQTSDTAVPVGGGQ